MTTAPVRTALWTQLRDELRTRREARDVTKALQHDLASFTTESDLIDLDAIIDRQDPADTVEIRRILIRQRAA